MKKIRTKNEERLKRKEKDAARNEYVATPVPSGDELTPSEAGLTEMEPDLRDRLDKTRQVRDTLGEGPDLREALVRSRREKEERDEKEKRRKGDRPKNGDYGL